MNRREAKKTGVEWLYVVCGFNNVVDYIDSRRHVRQGAIEGAVNSRLERDVEIFQQIESRKNDPGEYKENS
ncbi:MAG: hypothetical protein ABW172_06720 [Candidatus Binatia bacterium]|jgi:hypothetical protein